MSTPDNLQEAKRINCLVEHLQRRQEPSHRFPMMRHVVLHQYVRAEIVDSTEEQPVPVRFNEAKDAPRDVLTQSDKSHG